MEIFNTAGTCARQIIFRVDDEDRVTEVRFIGGCSGNLQAIAKLVNGLKVDDVIAKLRGLLCRSGTSCPDQLARALEQFKKKKEAEQEEQSRAAGAKL